MVAVSLLVVFCIGFGHSAIAQEVQPCPFLSGVDLHRFGLTASDFHSATVDVPLQVCTGKSTAGSLIIGLSSRESSAADRDELALEWPHHFQSGKLRHLHGLDVVFSKKPKLWTIYFKSAEYYGLLSVVFAKGDVHPTFNELTAIARRVLAGQPA